jgi:SAM-dependent methyltransferase
MRSYWRLHARQWADLDRGADPEGLTNVCYNGAPLWLNQFAARCQVAAFMDLAGDVAPLRDRRVLDVGCGTGRWSRLMTEQGARVVGIDLQPETLRDDRRRLPSCRFVEMSADFLGFASGRFDLVTSVTVIQHMPPSAQAAALSEMRRVLVDGGRLLILEHTRDQGPHVFAHAPEEWIRLAAAAGFRLDRSVPYDFAPLVYVVRRAASTARGAGAGGRIPVERYVARFRSAGEARGLARRAYHALLRAATAASYPIEPVMRRVAPASWAHHVGLLFTAV